MMPIQSFSSFERMTQFCRTQVPDKIWTDLAPMKDDDEAVKSYGVDLCVSMCNVLGDAGIAGKYGSVCMVGWTYNYVHIYACCYD